MEKLKETEIPMLTDEEARAITLLKRKLLQTFKLRKLVLFGSKARADFTRESDVDLLVLVDEDKTLETRSKLSDIQFEVIFEVDQAPLMCVLENYSAWLDENRWIAIRNNVNKEGIEIDLQ